jgi:hypothetical protein
MNALLDAVLDLAKAVGDEFEGSAAGKILDGKNGLENGLQPDGPAVFPGGRQSAETW